jgi:polar amino acid transport system permease protein
MAQTELSSTSAVPAGVLAEIEAGRRRGRRSFRLKFVIVWVLIVGSLIATLWALNKINPPFIAEWAPFILGGAGLTVLICATSIVFATILALIGAIARLSSNVVAYSVSSLYVSLVRGTPLLFQIFFIYLALPQVGIVIPVLIGGIAALSFNYGAYMTEIFRAGIQAVPRGQREAAQALGMPERMIMRRIVLPQAIRIVIPAIGNDFVAMIKDSALVSTIGVQELLWRAQNVGRQNFRTLETMLVAALVYWILTIIFSFFQERLEKRMARGDR